MTTTWNPLDKHADIVLSNNDMNARATTAGWKSLRATTGKGVGRKYFEVEVINQVSNRIMIGVGTDAALLTQYPGENAVSFGYFGNNGYKYHSGTSSTFDGSAYIYTTGDVIGVAVDIDYGFLWFSKNGVWLRAVAGWYTDPENFEYWAYSSVALKEVMYPMTGFDCTDGEVNLRTTSTGCTYSPPKWFSYWDSDESDAVIPNPLVRFNPNTLAATNCELLDNYITLRNTYTGSTRHRGCRANNPKRFGKRYFEGHIITTYSTNGLIMIGISLTGIGTNATYLGESSSSWSYYSSNGYKYTGAVSTAFGDALLPGNKVGVAVDLDAGKIWWAKNNVWQDSGDPATGSNAAFTNSLISDNWVYPAASVGRGYDAVSIATTSYECEYAPPDGFTYWSDYYYFDGYVRELGAPAVRKIYAYRRDTGVLVGYTTSSGDGYYELVTFYEGNHNLICMDAEDPPYYTDLIIGNVYPELVTVSG